MNEPGTTPGWLAGIRCVALDYGGTIDDPGSLLLDGSHEVDPAAIPALRNLAASGITLVLSSNTRPGEHRMAALVEAGIGRLFRLVLMSSCIGIRKPDPDFYALITAATHCYPAEILHVGNNIRTDIIGPASSGMNTALIRPHGVLTDLEQQMMPPGTIMIRHITELPHMLGCQLPP